MLLALLLGSLVGVTLGILGGGGSTLAIPLLTYGLGIEPREAIATSLVVVGLAALAGASRHWRQGTIDLQVALRFGILGSLGSAGGAQLARWLAPPVQMTLFALTLLVAAGSMLRPVAGARAGPGSWAGGARNGLIAIGAGLLTGLVGVGGGFVVVPALVGVVGLPMRRAVGTSLLVIAFNSLGGLAGYLSYVRPTGSVWLPFALAAVLTAIGGAGLASRFEEAKLRSAFAVSLILMGIFTIAKESFDLWA
jgi:hypothetical protein